MDMELEDLKERLWEQISTELDEDHTQRDGWISFIVDTIAKEGVDALRERLIGDDLDDEDDDEEEDEEEDEDE